MMAPEISPGLHSGSTTLKKVSSLDARKLAATSSGRVPRACMALWIGCTMKGREYKTEPTTKPQKVKVSKPSPRDCVNSPTGPCGPIITSR